MNDYSFSVIQDSLLQGFPTTPSQCDSSLAFQLLNRFSLAFIFVPDGDVPAEFTQYKRSIEKAASLLKALASQAFSDEAVEDGESVSPSSPTVRRAQRKWQQSRRASRASTRSSHSPVVEKTPFSDYGVGIPLSGLEATELSSRVLAEQKEILKVRRIMIDRHVCPFILRLCIVLPRQVQGGTLCGSVPSCIPPRPRGTRRYIPSTSRTSHWKPVRRT